VWTEHFKEEVNGPVFYVEKGVSDESEVTVVRHVAGAENRSRQLGVFEAVQRSLYVGCSEFEGATIPAGEGIVNAEYPDPSESSQCADNSVHRVLLVISVIYTY
jgi:hypothetical protein